ncbi:MAG TPA: serpin family protein [Chloroflexota bacterium]|nr:serpin family protein [Chloroflexota bacterium]
MSTYYSRRLVLQRGLLAAGSLGAGSAMLYRAPYTFARAIDGQAKGAQLQAANLDFAFRLFGQLARSANQNTFLSPLSVSLALAMTANGARGATQQAMLSTLSRGHLGTADLNQASAALIAGLRARDPHVQLAIADSLWTRQGLPVRPQFAQALKSAYGAQVTSLNFADPGAPAVINRWVDRQTHGLIPMIVNTIPPEALLYLINTLYFKADWQQQFHTSSTRQQPFSLSGGQKVQVPMMSTGGSFFYYGDASYQAIALPYGNGKFSMYILLPAAGADFATFQKGLTAQSWNTTLSKLTMEQGIIALPRFTVSYGANLNAALSALGMGVAFGPHADLSGIFVNRPALISAVLHKAVMKVYEAGTTAAAVTSVMVGAQIATQYRFTMTVNRPFFCAIADTTTGTLLFMGAIVEPRS